MKAKDVMTAEPSTLGPGNSVWHAARLMVDKGVSGLPVLDDGGRLVGIITEGDLIRRTEIGLSGDTPPETDAEARMRDFVKSHSWQVGDAMTSDIITATEETSLAEVASLMRKHAIKRVPVMRDQRLVGIVSRADLLRCVAETASRSTVRDDEALRVSVRAHLRDQQDLIGELPDVRVDKGVVYLDGNVASEAARSVIRVTVENVPGIVHLEDRLTLKV